MKEHSAPVYKMATSSRLSVNNRLYPQEASVATLWRASSCQWLDLFTMVSSLMKIAECWYYDVGQLPILPVLFRFIESPIICSLYSRTSYIHAFIHSYINTFMHTQHICNINSHMVASVTHSLAWLHSSVSVLTHHVSSGQS